MGMKDVFETCFPSPSFDWKFGAAFRGSRIAILVLTRRIWQQAHDLFIPSPWLPALLHVIRTGADGDDSS